MSSPWAKIEPIEGPTNFLDITSEQLAQDLEEKELRKLKISTTEEVVQEECGLFETDGTDSDGVIAHLLQAQFNHEHDVMLKRSEEKFNGNSKVGISYCNYRASLVPDFEEKKPDLDDRTRDFDRFVQVEKEYATMPRCGYKKVGEGSEIVTKHDLLMSSRINACRVLEFPPGIQTGDTGGFDVKLNNKVFNSLRAHSHAHCSREKSKFRPRAKKAESKTTV
ncbi:serine/threonine-protein kinase RIO3 [Orussus abietinus]|uniref:serine/threonine-protein kinase RIO3 n=1 Tax=Orussus abietinus TaxID=222816 RepID=UPI00062627EA|nr:serine/threonine-protein kinase RIO3 [Orussus abietinus]